MPDLGVALPAIVLAGAPAELELKAAYSIAYRAEVPIAGKMIVQHVIDALGASSHVGNICVVGDIECSGAARTVPSAGSLVDNLIVGMNACGSDGAGRVLVATSDIPLVTSAAIDDFVERCGELDADLYYSLIPKDACEQRFPGMRRTCARLAEGTFTGGNVVVMSRRLVIENAGLLREVVDARKSVMRLARLVGLRILVRAVIAQVLWPRAVNLALLEKAAGRILNAQVKVVQTPFAEIGADVDDLQQVQAVERLLKGV